MEITHGFNGWFECGVYIFTSITEGLSWQTGKIISIATYITTARRQQREKVQHGAAECGI